MKKRVRTRKVCFGERIRRFQRGRESFGEKSNRGLVSNRRQLQSGDAWA